MPTSYRSTSQARRALYATASLQGGYFTAKQAAAVGYRKQHLDYHTRTGNFERIGRGLYRLPDLPASEHDDLIRWSLWSRGRDDRPQAVVSHETALRIHDLGDVLPEKVHLSVAPDFRKPCPRGCILHRACLGESDVEHHDGFRVTTPLRTLLDIATGPVARDQVEKALREALRRGLLRRSQIETGGAGHPGRTALLGLLRPAA
ncbi:MAG: type IV toxin-antitoxin system AbiEi family antitoxin domain-containing protein [Acidobacteriota bacterium]|nr:type IV toxin-antitoxin system AbiEi family antitoxin domain-containing protein [Acidobacteriota bacterium]